MRIDTAFPAQTQYGEKSSQTSDQGVDGCRMERECSGATIPILTSKETKDLVDEAPYTVLQEQAQGNGGREKLSLGNRNSNSGGLESRH